MGDMLRTTLALLLAAGLLTGCTATDGVSPSDSGSPEATTTPTAAGSASAPAPSSGSGGAASGGATTLPSGALTLTLVRTGGFVGVNQTITIAADGSWTYVDKRAGTTSTGKLSPDQVGQLVKLLQDPALAQDLRQPSGVVCSDAFEYAVTLGSLSAMVEDCGQVRPSVDAVLMFVTDSTDF
jgi:hypothetical protein